MSTITKFSIFIIIIYLAFIRNEGEDIILTLDNISSIIFYIFIGYLIVWIISILMFIISYYLDAKNPTIKKCWNEFCSLYEGMRWAYLK